jgi:hypothetical protein
MNFSSLSRQVVPVAGFGLLVSCGAGSSTSTTPTVPISPFCSILEAENCINAPLHEANSSERIDATTNNHFNVTRGVHASVMAGHERHGGLFAGHDASRRDPRRGPSARSYADALVHRRAAVRADGDASAAVTR